MRCLRLTLILLQSHFAFAQNGSIPKSILGEAVSKRQPGQVSETKNQPSSCDEFQKHLNNLTTLEGAVKFCADKKPDLLMIGETHFKKSVTRQYPPILEVLKKYHAECLFIESESTYQNVLNDFMNCKKNFEECYAPVKEANSKTFERNEPQPLNIFTPELARKANEMGLKIYAVLSASESENSDPNLVMANKIKSKINDCHGLSVMAVGHSHIVRTFSKETATRKSNVANQLRRMGLKVQGLLLSDEKSYHAGLKLPECPGSFAYPVEVRGMIHGFSQRIIHTRPMQGMEDVEVPSYWNQFCASILIPAPKP